MLEMVYLAAQWQRKEEMRHYREVLFRYGIHVTSRWLDLSYEGPNEGPTPLIDATADLRDLTAADTVIFFSNGDGSQSTGGRHTEFGLALGMGRATIVIGPPENVFHHLAGNTFKDWSDFERYLAAHRSREVYPHGGRNQ